MQTLFSWVLVLDFFFFLFFVLSFLRGELRYFWGVAVNMRTLHSYNPHSRTYTLIKYKLTTPLLLCLSSIISFPVTYNIFSTEPYPFLSLYLFIIVQYIVHWKQWDTCLCIIMPLTFKVFYMFVLLNWTDLKCIFF